MDANNQKTIPFAQVTDIGCVRELNEDTLFCGQNMWLVADGMGGHACGEVASQLASQTIAEEFAKSGSIVEPIRIAHRKIITAGQQGVGQSGMGTTVVVLRCFGNEYEIAWVGDSRAYLWDSERNKLTQLTEDHSFIVRLVKSGLISAADARNHPQKHMITQCLGSVEIEQPQVDTCLGHWQPGQQILLCSDGLSDDVTEEEMSHILQQDLSNEDKLSSLVALAKQKGGKDNISLIMVDSPVLAKPSFGEKLKLLLGRYVNRFDLGMK